MTNARRSDASPDAPISLFDGDDVDMGEDAPGHRDFTTEELAGIRASQQDRDTPPADATEAS